MNNTQSTDSIIETIEQFISEMNPDFEMVMDFMEAQGYQLTKEIEDVIDTMIDYDWYLLTNTNYTFTN